MHGPWLSCGDQCVCLCLHAHTCCIYRAVSTEPESVCPAAWIGAQVLRALCVCVCVSLHAHVYAGLRQSSA